MSFQHIYGFYNRRYTHTGLPDPFDLDLRLLDDSFVLRFPVFSRMALFQSRILLEKCLHGLKIILFKSFSSQFDIGDHIRKFLPGLFLEIGKFTQGTVHLRCADLLVVLVHLVIQRNLVEQDHVRYLSIFPLLSHLLDSADGVTLGRCVQAQMPGFIYCSSEIAQFGLDVPLQSVRDHLFKLDFALFRQFERDRIFFLVQEGIGILDLSCDVCEVQTQFISLYHEFIHTLMDHENLISPVPFLGIVDLINKILAQFLRSFELSRSKQLLNVLNDVLQGLCAHIPLHQFPQSFLAPGKQGICRFSEEVLSRFQ